MAAVSEQSFAFENSVISFTKTGTGPFTLITFHGFGQDESSFIPLKNGLSARYTFYSIDLFFHGASQWGNDEAPLKKAYWKLLLSSFLEKNNIQRFSVVGFSLGGKIALATLELFASRIDDLILLAPDGIKTSIWYNLATYPVFLRSYFKSLIQHEHRLKRIVRFARALKLVDKGVLRFVENQMNTEEKRKRVYYSWIVYRRLRIDLDLAARLVHEHDIRLIVFAGKYDKVIPPGNIKALLKRLKKIDFYELEAGHNDLIKKAAEVLAKKLI